MRQFIEKYKHAWIMGYIFIYLPWFFYLEKTVRRNYHIIHTWLDDLIPFNEYFIIAYYAWFLYVCSAVLFFFFKNKQDYYRLCAYLFSGMTLSLLICTLFHNGTDLRPVVDPDKNLCSRLVYLIHLADTPTNIFPSIHVFNSIAVHIGILKSATFQNNRKIHVASFILCVLICMSTVFLKQHSVVDVVGGTLLAYFLYPFVYNEEYATAKARRTRKALG